MSEDLGWVIAWVIVGATIAVVGFAWAGTVLWSFFNPQCGAPTSCAVSGLGGSIPGYGGGIAIGITGLVIASLSFLESWSGSKAEPATGP